MKILIAPDSFKGSLTAREATQSIAEGFTSALPNAQCIEIPMADGGEGTLEALAFNQDMTFYTVPATNPLGATMTGTFGVLKDKTAVIETATVSGLTLVPHNQRNPLHHTSFGSGELILAALDKGCRRFIIGLGGSATVDFGIGALQALGIRFCNRQGQDIAPTAAALETLAVIDTSGLDPRLADSEFILAHDVNNSLLGPKGAILYAPQKGVPQKDLKKLSQIYAHTEKIISETTQKHMGHLPGTGAAGGLAGGLFAFLNATLKPGAEVVLEHIGLRAYLQSAHLVITGEGRIDDQTVWGKTPIAVAKLAKTFNIPVIAIAAQLGKGYPEVYHHGIDAVFSMTDRSQSTQECFASAKPLLVRAANNIARLIALRIMP